MCYSLYLIYSKVLITLSGVAAYGTSFKFSFADVALARHSKQASSALALRNVQVSSFRFQVSSFRFQVSGFKFQVSSGLRPFEVSGLASLTLLWLTSSTLLHFGKTSKLAFRSAFATLGIVNKFPLLSLCATFKFQV